MHFTAGSKVVNSSGCVEARWSGLTPQSHSGQHDSSHPLGVRVPLRFKAGAEPTLRTAQYRLKMKQILPTLQRALPGTWFLWEIFVFFFLVYMSSFWCFHVLASQTGTLRIQVSGGRTKESKFDLYFRKQCHLGRKRLRTSLWNDSGLAYWLSRRKGSSLLSSDIFIEFWYLYRFSILPSQKDEGEEQTPKGFWLQFKQGLILRIKREYFTKSSSQLPATYMVCVETKDMVCKSVALCITS